MTMNERETHIRLQYLPTPNSKVWRNSSLTMWKAGLEKMKETAEALKAQEKWHDWRIVSFDPHS